MGGISKGLDFLRRQKAASEARDNSTPIFKLWVSSGDTAKFYILADDVDADMMAPMVHSLERTIANGDRKGEKFKVDVLCERETRDEPLENCKYCSEGVEGPWHRLITWVWVDTIVHDKLKVNKKTGSAYEWEMMKRGNTKVYVETPDPRVRLFIMKTKVAQQIMKKYDEQGSLFDRSFKLEKTGTQQSTQEILSCPEEAQQLPPEVIEAYKNLPSLEEAIRQEFGRYTTQSQPAKTGRGAASSEAATDENDSGLEDF